MYTFLSKDDEGVRKRHSALNVKEESIVREFIGAKMQDDFEPGVCAALSASAAARAAALAPLPAATRPSALASLWRPQEWAR